MARGVLVIFSSILLFVISIVYPIVQFESLADSQVIIFNDGTTEKELKVPDLNTSFSIELPSSADVISASMKITLMDYNNQFPLNPILRIGTTSDPLWNEPYWNEPLWKYTGKGYGGLGNQYLFSTGATELESIYRENSDSDDLKILLPASAEVYSASLNLTGQEYDHWSDDILELNREPDAAGDYEPDMMVFNDRLYTVYRSYDPLITHGNDTDIVINSTSNGINWSQSSMELTPVPDSPPPYEDTFSSADWRPSLEIFNNRLFCAWESNSTVSTNDLDHDIILRSSANGNTWDNIIKVSDGLETMYSNNTGSKDDWSVDMATFNNNLWLIWTTNNTNTSGNSPDFSTPMGDIIIANSTDGITWNNATDLTAGDPWFTHDITPKLIAFNNSLYAVWVSNNSKFGDIDDYDFDIVFKNTSDGVNWSPLKSINPNDNNFLGYGDLDSQPTLQVYDNKLFCAWMSTASEYTHGINPDIVIRFTSNGNFSESANIFEVSDRNVDRNDHSPSLEVFKDRLYISWVYEQFGNSEIMTRNYNIQAIDEKLSQIQKVNPADQGGADYWPKLSAFKNNLYTVWVSNDTSTSTGGDKDIILRSLTPSALPLKVGLDVGGDGTWDVQKNSTLTSSKTKFDITTGLKGALANQTWIQENSKVTKYDYRICEIPLKLNFFAPGKVFAENLNIYYRCSFVLKDFSDKLNEYLSTHQNDKTGNDTIIIPFTLSDEPGIVGKMKISEINLIFNNKPSISIVEPPAGGIPVKKPVYRLKWTDADLDSDANISLYYDTDNTGYDGKLIISNLSEDDATNYYDWAWWRIEELQAGGNYYIYANITDDRNYQLSYSPGPLQISKINIRNFLNISILEPDGVNDEAWDVFNISWTSYSSSENAKIYLFYDDDNTSFDGTGIDVNIDGQVDDQDFITRSQHERTGSFLWNLSELPLGSTIYIYAKITDTWNISYYNYSVGSISRSHLPTVRNFSLLDDQDPSTSVLTTHNQTPTFGWSSPIPEAELAAGLEFEYTFNIWQGLDKTGNNVYKGTTKNAQITIDKPLEYGSTYFAEVFASVSGNDSEKTSLIFSVLNEAPGAPTIQITPKSPKTTAQLTCEIVTDSADVDGDPIIYQYFWFKNGVLQTDDYINESVPNNATSKGERWKCIVMPFDGIDFGLNASTEVVIRNSPPTITIESPKESKEYVDNKIIFFNFTVFDPDPGDDENLQYIIFSNLDGLVKSGIVPKNTGVVEFTATLSKGDHQLFINVSDGETSVEESLAVEVIEQKGEGIEGYILPILIVIIIVIIVLLLIFLALFRNVHKLKKEGIESRDEENEEMLDEVLAEEELEDEELVAEELEEDELEDEDLEEEEPEDDELEEE